MDQPVTIVFVRSLSYTGTTWLNLVLGGHERAFVLGPADQAWNERAGGWRDRCRVHGGTCAFWPAFGQRYDPQGNFFVQLAEASGRDVIVTNNLVPNGAGRELSHPRLVVKPIQFVRDGRAIAASYARKFPEKSFLDAVQWMKPSFSTFRFDRDDPDLLCLRYEDVLADQDALLERAGAWLGLEYDRSALEYWRWDHHPAAGNMGTNMMLRLAQGLDAGGGKDAGFYREQFERLQRGEGVFRDERWKEELSRRDLFVFDHLCGTDNERFGYERDRFTVTEMETFARELDLALAPARGGRAPRGTRRFVTVPSAASLGLGSPGLRRQLAPAWLWTRGLSLTPSQVHKLAALAAVTLLAAIVLAALLAAILAR